ncbi:DEAD/DEAH box helicase family protein, partial [Vibrio harveyi]
SSLRLAMILSV